MSVIDNFKSISNLLRKVRDADLKAELQQALLETQGALLELQERSSEQQQELGELKSEVQRLNDIGELRNNIELRDDGLYYLRASVEGRHDGPYCTRCFDRDGCLVTATKMAEGFHVIGHYTCNHCKANY